MSLVKVLRTLAVSTGLLLAAYAPVAVADCGEDVWLVMATTHTSYTTGTNNHEVYGGTPAGTTAPTITGTVVDMKKPDWYNGNVTFHVGYSAGESALGFGFLLAGGYRSLEETESSAGKLDAAYSQGLWNFSFGATWRSLAVTDEYPIGLYGEVAFGWQGATAEAEYNYYADAATSPVIATSMLNSKVNTEFWKFRVGGEKVFEHLLLGVGAIFQYDLSHTTDKGSIDTTTDSTATTFVPNTGYLKLPNTTYWGIEVVLGMQF